MWFLLNLRDSKDLLTLKVFGYWIETKLGSQPKFDLALKGYLTLLVKVMIDRGFFA